MMTSSSSSSTGITFESSSGSAVSVPRVISGLSAVSSEENLFARAGAITKASAAGTLTTEVSAVHRVVTAPLGVGTAAAAASASAKKGGKGSNAKSGSDGGENTSNDAPGGKNRRQKRLERNRESARLSRRRRKQYLEVLEERVTQLSDEMDTLRRAHVAVAVSTIQQKRHELLQAASVGQYHHHHQHISSNALLYTSPELILASVFRSQQLKSFALPPAYKFVLWLTLQNDTYFRGGRAASERLSAARIGERVST